MAQQWSYRVLKEVEFGGFVAELLEGRQRVFVRALAWKGQQPRLTLGPNEPGFADWMHLLESAPDHEKTVSFAGNDEFAQNLDDQWLTHSP